MRARLGSILVGCLVVLLIAGASAAPKARGPSDQRRSGGLPQGFVPAIARNATGRYFVRVDAPSVANRVSSARAAVLQEDVLHAARRLGAHIAYRFTRVMNGFSAELSARA